MNENRDLHNTWRVFDRLRFYSDYDISDGDVIESEEIRLLYCKDIHFYSYLFFYRYRYEFASEHATFFRQTRSPWRRRALSHALDATPFAQVGEEVPLGVAEEHSGRPDARGRLPGQQVERPVRLQVEEVEPGVLPAERRQQGRREGEVLRGDVGEGDDVDVEGDAQGLARDGRRRRDEGAVAHGDIHEGARHFVALVETVDPQIATLVQVDADAVGAGELSFPAD